MRKACCDCIHLGSYGGTFNRQTVECARHPKQYVSDAFEHIKTYVCAEFAPDFLSDPDPTLLHALKHARRTGKEPLRHALDVWFAGPPNDVTVATGRGEPMLSVADGGLETFEGDKALKSYKNSNHVFADVFGPARVSWPILLFLSLSNSPGVSVESTPGSVSIVYLGRPYSLAEITAAYSYILAQQGIRLIRPWFRRVLREAGINPNDSSFASFSALPEDVERFLISRRESLLRSHTVIVAGDDVPDLGAVAEALGLNEKETGVVWADARNRFHLTTQGETRYEFASPWEMSDRLEEMGLRNILVHPQRFYDIWPRLPADAFLRVETLLSFVDRDGETRRLPCFAECTVSGLDP